MAQTRDHLPKILQSTDAKKAWCKKILKHYVVKRLHLWGSAKGTMSKYGKYAATIISLGKYGSLKSSEEILKDCNAIKTDIEAAATFQAYIKLIDKLHKFAVEAKDGEIPAASSPSLRTDTYYAIIAMIHEILKNDFPVDYQREIERILGNLEIDKKAYKNYYPQGRSREEIYEAVNGHLRQLVLLGYKPVYYKAFEFYRNLFPTLFVPKSGKFSFIEEKEARGFKVLIEVQIEQEQGLKIHLEDLHAPNQNIPYQLQPDFAMIFCHKELKKSLGFCTKIALEEDLVENGKSFHELYEFNREKFIADNLVEDKAPKEDVQQGADRDVPSEIAYLPVDGEDAGHLPLPAETTVEYDFEIEEDLSEDEAVTNLVSEGTDRVKPLPILPSEPVPAPPPAPEPPQARVSALGTFAQDRPEMSAVVKQLKAEQAAKAVTEEAELEQAVVAPSNASAEQPAVENRRRTRKK